MRQITLRGIEPSVERKIRKIAKTEQKSLNQVIKTIIHKEFGALNHRARVSAIKELAGGWTPEDATEFEHSIRSCEQIDEDMWR